MNRLLQVALLISYISKFTLGFSQCSNMAEFSSLNTYCSGDEVFLYPNYQGFTSFEWDFFSGDLEMGIQTPALDLDNPSSIIASPRAFSIVKEDSFYYGFVPMLAPVSLKRIDFGHSLNVSEISIPSDLSNPFDQLVTAASRFEVVNKKGFIGNGNTILRYDFDNGFGSAPTGYQIFANTALGEFSNPRNLRIFEDNGNYYALVCNNAGTRHLSILSFGNDLSNTPVLVQKVDMLNTINNNNNAIDADIIKICNDWFVFAVLSNGQLLRLNFGSSLTNVPVKTLYPLTDFSFNTTTFLELAFENNKYYLSFQTSNSRYFLYDLGSDGLQLSQKVISPTNFFGNTAAAGYDLVKENSTWHVFGINRSNGRLYKTTFNNANTDQTSIKTDSVVTSLPYSSPGTYYIGFRGIDSLNNSSSWIDTIVVSNNIIPEFTINNSCIDNPIEFTENLTLNGLTVNQRKWFFGTGDTSTLENPEYTYSNIGQYLVELEILANNGCTSSYIETVEISNIRPEHPSFQISPNIICENTVIDILNSSYSLLDSIVSAIWDFGDGFQSIDFNPSHSYLQAGNYEIQLTLTGTFGCDTTISSLIQVNPGPSPDFQFQNLCFGDTVEFFDLSNAILPSQIIGWEWDFGDGSPIQNSTTPKHFYQNSGDYNVTLTIETDDGCKSSITKPLTINILPSPNFSVPIVCALSTSTLESSFSVSFTDWIWETSSGNVYIGSTANVLFENEGEEYITLTVTDTAGCSGSTTKIIEIFPALLPDFTYENYCAGDSVSFMDATPSFSVVEWLWSFGLPNAFSFEQNPKQRYNNPGFYTVNLTVTNAIGCESTVSKIIDVKAPPLASIGNDSACLDDELFVFSTSQLNNDPVVSYVWVLNGDTLAFMADSLLLMFEELGTYEVAMYIQTESGCEADAIKTITVYEKPTANFRLNPTYGVSPQPVQFTNLSQDASSYFWDFGDGTGESNAVNPIYTYLTNGVYTIILQAINENGCSDFFSREIPVIPSELDIELRNLQLSTQLQPDGSLKIQPKVQLVNVGTRVIENAELHLRLDGQIDIVESWSGSIPTAGIAVYTFSTFYSVSAGYDARYVCVEAKNVNDGSEENLSNNRACKVLQGQIQISNPYPNPATNLVNIDLITESAGNAALVLYEVSGKKVMEVPKYPLERGLNKIQLDLRSVFSGEYYLKISYLNDDYVKPLVISNK